MRWKPTRAGIYNIWEYDDQVFDFGDGRLVLRGRNGSGKSNALALVFPFLLDGVMSAARMDPMGGSRSMKSLLLGRDDGDRAGTYRHDSGTGYVWMELSKGTEHLTIGVGASATVHRDADPWFFIVDGRVEVDVALAERDVPLSRRQLTERLPAGAVHRSAEEYRSALDRRLFGLGPARYRSLVDLLLTLRRPHLAGKLDTDHLSATLSAGLGEVDASLIEDVAHSFDDLDAMQHELDGLASSLDAVERFLPYYRDHLVAVGRARAETVAQCRSALRRIERDQRRADGERVAADATRGQVDADIVALQSERRHLEDTIDNVQQSPAYQSAVALAEVNKAAVTATEAAQVAESRAEASTADAATATEVLTQADQAVEHNTRSVEETIGEWRTAASTAGIGLPSESTLDLFDTEHAVAVVVERRSDVVVVTELARTAGRAAVAAESAENELTDRTGEAARAATDLQASESADRETSARLAERRTAWAELVVDGTRRLVDAVPDRSVPVPDIDGLFESTSGYREAAEDQTHRDDPVSDPDAGELVAGAEADVAAFHPVDRRLGDVVTTAMRALDAAAADSEAQRLILDELHAERQRVAEEANPGPPPNPTRPDAGRPANGTPLFVCVDFADHVDADARAGLEAALGAAGLLDARITAEGTLDDALDAQVVGAHDVDASRRTLADLLEPVAVDGLDMAVIHDALAAVPVDDDIVELHDDGRWRLGPLAGRYHQDEARFIGHAARERRRATRLGELDAQVAHELGELARREDRHSRLIALHDELAELRSAQPSADSLARALEDLRIRSIRLDERARAAEVAQRRADELGRAAESATAELHRAATAHRLPVEEAGLDTVTQTLAACDRATELIVSRRDVLDLARTARDDAADALRRAAQRAETDLAQASQAHTTAEREARRYAELRADVGGDAEQAIEQLAQARERRGANERRATELRGAQAKLASELATLAERLRGLERDQAVATAAAQDAIARFAVICSAEVAEVIDIDGLGPEVDAAAAAKRLVSATETANPDATNRMEKAHREILLDGLRAGHDPSMPKVDGLDVVRVGTADGEVPIGTLARSLREEHQRASMLLSDREREIFETHLLTNVGEALRHLLLEADAFEHRINAEMAKAPTESGMIVELSWEVADDEPGVRAAISSLRTDANLLGPERREALREFFMSRIADQRSVEPGRSFAETLTGVLDYRAWHRFALYARFADGKRQRVTRKFFKGLSGGEAATLLHLPLFASAASQYSSGSIDGPRLIALDEAFAGIDDQMRARLMGLLTQLDLDVILTSHEFWGFYGSVPSLVLYDLVRRPPNPGVFAQRFDWATDDHADRPALVDDGT